MTIENRRAHLTFAVLSTFLLGTMPGAAQSTFSLQEFERELKATLADGRARFEKEYAREIRDLTTVPVAIMPHIAAKPAPAASDDGVSVKQRLILMRMQLNTIETIKLTMEGLLRLGKSDAPSENQVAVAETVVIHLRADMNRLEAAALSHKGSGMHESSRMTRKGLDRLQELGASLKNSNSWGGEQLLTMRQDMGIQLEAVVAAVKDDSLIPTLKADGLKEQWLTFSKSQQEGLKTADDALAQSKITEGEYVSLIMGRRDLAQMWSHYQEEWLKR